MKAICSITLAAFAAMTSIAAMANTTYYLRDSYNDKAGAMTTPAAWNTQLNGQGTDATAIDETGDFVVANSRWLRFQSSKGESFAGNSLTIQRGYLYWYDACNTLTLTGSLVFRTGAFVVNRQSDDSRSEVNADIKFEAPEDRPFGIGPGSNSNVLRSWVNFNGKFAADAGIRVDIGYTRTSASKTANDFVVLINGDYGDFNGLMCVTSINTSAVYPSYGCSLALNAASTRPLPGGVTVTSNCVLTTTHNYYANKYASGCVTVGDLTLNPYSTLFISGSNDCFEATKSLSVTGPVRVRLTYEHPAATTNRIPILKAPAGTQLKLSDFVFDIGVSENYNTETAGLVLSNDGRTLSVEYRTVVSLATTDKTDMKVSGQTSALSPGHGSQWSDGAEPHELAVYTVAYPKALRTPQDNSLDCVFPGSLLKMKIGSNLLLASKSFTADVRYDGNWGNLLGVNQYCAYYRLKGTLDLASGWLSVTPMNSGTIEIESPITGIGGLQVKGKSDTGAPQGATVLSGANGNWLGKIQLTQGSGTSSGEKFPSLKRFQTFRVGKAESLGGKLAERAYDALLIRDYSKFQVTNSVTLADNVNRGILVSTNGQIGVSGGVTLTVGWPLTLDGSLYKNGSGTLVLGGPAKFRSGTTIVDAPSAGQTNYMAIQAGAVKVAACDSVNGFTVWTQTAATPIALDFNPTDADLKRYGIRNVKTDQPFITGKKVYLRLDGVDDAVIAAARATETGFKQGLFTVKTSAADALRANLVFTRPSRTRIVREDDAAAGTTTFSLYGKDQGLTVIVR